MKSKVCLFLSFLFSINSFAQSSIELTCRSKAKEIATKTYSTCITEARTGKIEEIRSNYQKELAALKAKYDKELEKIAGSGQKKSTQKAQDISASSSEQSPIQTLSKLPKTESTAKLTRTQNTKLDKNINSKTSRATLEKSMPNENTPSEIETEDAQKTEVREETKETEDTRSDLTSLHAEESL